MNLCFICPEYPPGPHGGIGTFTQTIARALVEVGHQVRVAGVYPNGYPAPVYEEDRGVRVWRIHEPATRLGWVTARIRLYWLIRNWVLARECDLVECSDAFGWIAGWPKLSIPVVLRAHGSLTFYAHELRKLVDPTSHRLENWSYRRADAWAAVSVHAGDLTAKLFKMKSCPDAILYNPIDVPNEILSFPSRQQGKVVFTGTLTGKKGIVSLFDAWPLVKARCPDAELHAYGKDGGAAEGSGTMKHYLLQRLPAGLRESVKFHGHVPRAQITQALSTARVGVFPSYTETFGLGAVEAMASACPTIYTKLTCGPEIVNNGIDGLLIDPDQPREIAESIVTLLLDDRLAERMGNAGRQRALQCFTLANLIPKNEAFFANVIHSFHSAEPQGVIDGVTRRPARLPTSLVR